MSDRNVPFYTQVALLDQYIHAEDPSSDQEMIRIIIEILRAKSDLRSYFFRSEPSVQWARILSENDFFSTSPEPQKTEQGISLIPWDAQIYLISIAPQVPEIVLKHIKTINGHSIYFGRAIEALCKIPSRESEKVLPIIIEWIQDETKRGYILNESVKYLNVLTNDGRWKSSIRLFEKLSAPQIEKTANLLSGSNFFRDVLIGTKIEPAAGFLALKKNVPESMIRILEKNLRYSSKKSGTASTQTRKIPSHWWRNAIEDTDQDILDSYGDLMLCALRDTLITEVNLNKDLAEKKIIQYLESPYGIFRRLGLYLLWTNGGIFPNLAAAELLKAENIDDIDIHHEYFMLMENCYHLLSSNEKKILLKRILNGPDEEQIHRLADWAEKTHHINRDEYIINQKKAWIRSRLWMIRNDLDNKTKKILEELIGEGGKPDHPDFLSWTSGAFSVTDVSPFPEQQLSDLTPDELYKLISKWRPGQHDFGPERISYFGLANTIANLILANPKLYSRRLYDIALLRPEYSNAMISHWANKEYKGKIPWRLALDLCISLVENPAIFNDERVDIDDISWIAVRMSMTMLIEIGLSKKNQLIPKKLLLKARNILLRLVDDPDPSLERGRPPEGWSGHNDFVTVSINAVRPMAVRSLISYGVRQALLNKRSTGIIELEKVVQETLTRKVNVSFESSRAVHSVFGECLPNLYWLNHEWVEQSLDFIFPLDDDDESKWFFLAAWDGYMQNKYFYKLFNTLRSRYKRAIHLIAEREISKSYMDPTGQFAIHLAADYLFSDVSQKLEYEQDNLLVEFINNTSPDIRSKIGWALWIICRDNPKELNRFWPKSKLCWEWRTNEATISNHAPDFSRELGEYSQLLLVAPPYETIKSLRHLLEGLLPYMQGSEFRNQLWNSTERFLANQVEQDPINCIKFYRLMYEQKINPPQWFYHSDEAQRIIEISAKNPNSRADALSLIDFLARWGDYKFREIYNRYSI